MMSSGGPWKGLFVLLLRSLPSLPPPHNPLQGSLLVWTLFPYSFSGWLPFPQSVHFFSFPLGKWSDTLNIETTVPRRGNCSVTWRWWSQTSIKAAHYSDTCHHIIFLNLMSYFQYKTSNRYLFTNLCEEKDNVKEHDPPSNTAINNFYEDHSFQSEFIIGSAHMHACRHAHTKNNK